MSEVDQLCSCRSRLNPRMSPLSSLGVVTDALLSQDTLPVHGLRYNYLLRARNFVLKIREKRVSLSDTCASRGEPASSGVAFHPKL
ncbi:hypothetical protein Tco_0881557 [Tanacetum coccineum]